MVEVMKIAIIKAILNSEEVSLLTKIDFIKIVIDADVEVKNQYPYITVVDGTSPPINY